MDHRAALKAIPPDTRTKLQSRSNTRGLLHLASYITALLVITIAIAYALPLWPLALIPQGLLLTFLFTLQHECTHDTPFRSPWLNRLIGHATGLILIQPFTWFRYFHMAHHRHTNDPAHDPELSGGPRPNTWYKWLWHVTGLPAWRFWIANLLQLAVAPQPTPYLPVRALPHIRLEARLMLAAYALAALTIGAPLLWLWVLPMLLTQPALRLYLLAEHGNCPPVANMLENTRTTYTAQAVRWLAWNMPYHAEHHAAPNVPFHQLPTLHTQLQQHLKSTSPSYRAFTKDFIAQLD